MNLKKRCFMFQFLLINIINVLYSNDSFILADSQESSRMLLFKRALHTRYGLEDQKSDPYSAIPMFEKLTNGYDDKIAVESLYQLGNIYLLGYRRLFIHRCDIPKATDYFFKSASMGHPISQYLMAFLHSYDIKNGPGLDVDKALEYLDSSVKNKFRPALLALAYHYLYHPTFPDLNRSIKLYKMAIRHDATLFSKTIECSDDLKVTEENIHNYKEAYTEYLKQRKRELKLKRKYTEDNKKNNGKCNAKVLGSEKNNDDGSELSTRDTQQHYETITKIEKILKDYEKSPEDLAPHLIDLAIMYLNGLGVPKNYETAVKLLDRAVSLGSSDGANILGTIYMFGLKKPDEGKAIAPNKKLAIKHFKIAASDHNAESLYFLGDIVSSSALTSGRILYPELEHAYHLYRLSADYGFPAAYLRCAELLEAGHGVEKDMVKAALNYKTLAEHFYHHDQHDRTFHYAMEGNVHEATVFSYMCAFSGLEVGQWNAATLLREHRSSVFNKNDYKTHLNNSLLQGNTDSLYHLAKLAESEGKKAVSQDLYQKGFNSGDLKCLDPLIKLYSKTNFKKAIDLLEYKIYRGSVDLNNREQGLIKNYYNKILTKRSLAFLKMKQMLHNLFGL